MNHPKRLTGTALPAYFFLIGLFLVLLPALIAATQKAASHQEPPLQPLEIGDALPHLQIANIYNHPGGTARLSDFRGKLLLLEFWATWCGSCKASMPKLEALQREFPDKLQVLLVTREEAPKVERFFGKWKSADGTPYALPSVVGDSVLAQLFPYRVVPHFVWVGPDGKVMTVTTAEHVTEENIRRVLTDGTLPAYVKKDIDLRQPLFAGSDLPTENLLHYAILLKGKIDGLPSGTRLREKDGTVVGRAITNKPLLALYQSVALHTIPNFNRNRLLLEVQDEEPLLPEKASGSPEEWKRRNLYSYDQLGPISEAPQLYAHMLQDLNTYSAYHGSVERRKTTCLVLVRTGDDRKLRTRGGPTESTLYQAGTKHLRNAPLLYLVKQLLSKSTIHLPVLDETGYTGNVDMEIKAELTDLPSLRRELQRHHLDLVEAEREIDMFVIRDKK